MVSGGIAALLSCPAEVTLVRISNDNTLPVESRRNYKGVGDAFQRILKEEGSWIFHSYFLLSHVHHILKRRLLYRCSYVHRGPSKCDIPFI
jgi:hypothetical protein